jgi:hypothetical protein
MSIFRILFLTLAAAANLAQPVFAQDKPDFSGTWKLNLTQSKSEEDAPKSLVFKIEHKDPAFKYTAKGEDFRGEPFTETAEFTIDGKQHPGPEPTRVAAHWDGQSLIMRFTLGDTPLQTITLRLSDDGRQMVRDIAARDRIGERSMHQVYDKE